MFTMDTQQFLQKIFDGYVQGYRRLNWHQSANYADMTALELNHFAKLGALLGFHVRREMNWHFPRDLCWCNRLPERGKPNTDESNKTVLYLERENEDGRVLEQTIGKMLNPDNAPDVPMLIAVLGWVRPKTLEAAKERIRKTLPKNQSFMLISWIGENKEGNADSFCIEGWIRQEESECSRRACPQVDGAGYWYIQFKEQCLPAVRFDEGATI